MSVETDTQQAMKDRIVAALVMNGWGRVFELWWRSYNRSGKVDQEVADRAVSAYLDRLADDIAEALVNGHYPDGTCPHPSEPPRQSEWTSASEGGTASG